MVGEEMAAIQDLRNATQQTITIAAALRNKKVKGTPVRFVQEAPIVIVFQITNLDSNVLSRSALLTGIKDAVKKEVVDKLEMIETTAFASATADGNTLLDNRLRAFIDVELFSPFTSTFLCSVTIAPRTGYMVTKFRSTDLHKALTTAIQGVDDIASVSEGQNAHSIDVQPMTNLPGYAKSGTQSLLEENDSIMQNNSSSNHNHGHHHRHKARLLGVGERQVMPQPTHRQALALMQSQAVDRVRQLVENAEWPEVVYVVEGRKLGASLSEASHKRRDLYSRLRDRLRHIDAPHEL
jgi:hypothetical protein